MHFISQKIASGVAPMRSEHRHLRLERKGMHPSTRDFISQKIDVSGVAPMRSEHRDWEPEAHFLTTYLSVDKAISRNAGKRDTHSKWSLAGFYGSRGRSRFFQFGLQ
jgi:hypothetical protein